MLRLILIFTLIAAGPALGQPGQSLRRAVALLDYVAGDYPRAVGPSGEVLSADEHAEQQNFVSEAAQELRDEAGTQGADLAERLDALRARIEARAPPAEVTSQARAVRDEIAQRFRVALLPPRPPDLARGAQLYAQACAACHGADGHAPPKEQLGLSTQPPSFAVPDEVRGSSPQRIFSAATYGVPGTAMPGYEDALDDAARWDLASPGPRCCRATTASWRPRPTRRCWCGWRRRGSRRAPRPRRSARCARGRSSRRTT